MKDSTSLIKIWLKETIFFQMSTFYVQLQPVQKYSDTHVIYWACLRLAKLSVEKKIK